MQTKYAATAAGLFHKAAKLRKLANEMEREASRIMEAQTSIEYDMAEDGQDGKLQVLDSAVNPKEDGELEKMTEQDGSAISEDPDMDFGGLIGQNDFRSRKKDEIKTSRRIRRRVRG